MKENPTISSFITEQNQWCANKHWALTLKLLIFVLNHVLSSYTLLYFSMKYCDKSEIGRKGFKTDIKAGKWQKAILVHPCCSCPAYRIQTFLATQHHSASQQLS